MVIYKCDIAIVSISTQVKTLSVQSTRRQEVKTQPNSFSICLKYEEKRLDLKFRLTLAFDRLDLLSDVLQFKLPLET